jgi:hypothetical protein
MPDLGSFISFVAGVRVSFPERSKAVANTIKNGLLNPRLHPTKFRDLLEDQLRFKLAFSIADHHI